MKAILVPVDFSKASKVALSFAVHMAEKMKARMIMLTVINGSSTPNTLANWRKLEASMVSAAKRDAEAWIKTINRRRVEITHQSILGFPMQDKVEQFIRENRIDVIIMGSKGGTGLKKTFIGSNAAALVQKSSVPVIVVPEKARLKPLKTLVYASDMKNFEPEIQAIARLTNDLDAKIQVVHITRAKYSKLKRLELENELMQYSNAVLHILKGADIISSIEKFARDHKADMIILFTHTIGLYEKLFGKSIARQFAFKGTLPIMTFNRSNTYGPMR